MADGGTVKPQDIMELVKKMAGQTATDNTLQDLADSGRRDISSEEIADAIGKQTITFSFRHEPIEPLLNAIAGGKVDVRQHPDRTPNAMMIGPAADAAVRRVLGEDSYVATIPLKEVSRYLHLMSLAHFLPMFLLTAEKRHLVIDVLANYMASGVHQDDVRGLHYEGCAFDVQEAEVDDELMQAVLKVHEDILRNALECQQEVVELMNSSRTRRVKVRTLIDTFISWAKTVHELDEFITDMEAERDRLDTPADGSSSS